MMAGRDLTEYSGDSDTEVATVPESEGPADTALDIREAIADLKEDDARGLARGESNANRRKVQGSSFERRVGIPKDFSPKAQAGWGQVPKSIKNEVHKALGQRDEYLAYLKPLVPFINLCQKNGTNLPTALARYNEIENVFIADPVRGLTMICKALGVDPVAAIRAWNVSLSNPGWQNQTQAPRQQQADPAYAEIEAMRRDPRFPGFDALRPRMSQLLTTGKVDDLQAAYFLAASERNKSSNAVARAKAAARSVSGAPGGGSGHSPGMGDPNMSRRDLIRAAIAAQRGEA
jgi:hypothetical protein